MATTTTALDGSWSARVPAGAQILLTSVSGGTYPDEATGETKALADGEHYDALFAHGGSDGQSVSITPLTHIAATVALASVRQGASLSLSIEDSHAAVALAAGAGASALALSLALAVEVGTTVTRTGQPGTRDGRLDRCERSERLAEADVAQLAERVLGKDEVTGSIPVIGSSLRSQLARDSGLRRQNERQFHLLKASARRWRRKNSIGRNRT